MIIPPQEGTYLLVGELTKALEEPNRRRGAADAVSLFCRAAKFDFQEHLPALLTVRKGTARRGPLLAGSVPTDLVPLLVARCLVATQERLAWRTRHSPHQRLLCLQERRKSVTRAISSRVPSFIEGLLPSS